MKAQIKKFIRNYILSEKRTLKGIRKEDQNLISSIKSNNLTYLSDKKLISLVKTIRDLEENNVLGVYIEAGCALGGSTILISSIKNPKRELFVYDVFGLIPPPTDADEIDVHKRYEVIKAGKSNGINGDKYYGYREDLFEVVQHNLKKFKINPVENKVSLIKGLLQDTMRVKDKVAFAHIDVDWYEPVKTCLNRIIPKLVSGGSIILDDYNDWSGCRKAVDEYFRNSSDDFIMEDSAGSMKITKL